MEFISSVELKRRVQDGREYAVVQNPGFVWPAEEHYELAPKVRGGLDRLDGVLTDMDGTTTTTETLCVHAIETMVRRITGRPTGAEWAGLDRAKDYPHIIGNSNTRHVEHLIDAYGRDIQATAFVRAWLESAAWTLVNGRDPGRRGEVLMNMRARGWDRILDTETAWRRLIGAGAFDAAACGEVLDDLARRLAGRLTVEERVDRVRFGLDIYCHRYHEILGRVAEGAGDRLAQQLVGGWRLIEPMPGVGIFLALVKGWLGTAAGDLYDVLAAEMRHAAPPAREAGRTRLAALGRRFAERPVRVGMVTASIRYEAEIVMNEVLRVIREQAAQWPARAELAGRFGRIGDVYDAMVTASNSNEIRLKPHRDLYSIALNAIGISPAGFGRVAAFEDSAPGTVAVRAAGIGLCVAMPFSDSTGHDLTAAAWVLRDGLPEAILTHNLFLA